MADPQAAEAGGTFTRKTPKVSFLPTFLRKGNRARAPAHPTSNIHPLLGTVDRVKPSPDLTTYGIKLGWIQGVLIPCLLNIWGVMLFLRIAWVVAQAGIGFTILIITISGIICVITTMSLSAICTNGKLRGGGVYYIVSRSLGAELGASVGILFAFANAVAASMNTIGFCESLNEQLKKSSLKLIDNSYNDIRIVGALTLLVMCVICAIGMDWETKTQNFLIITIVIAIFNYTLGVLYGPTSKQATAKGFVGLNIDTGRENWRPDFRRTDGENHNFFSVFAVYFPAVTGVQAGANICGDLKDPAIAIPKGTFVAVGLSTFSYLLMAVLSGMGAVRDASGRVDDIRDKTINSCKPNCPYGLHNNYEIMHLMSLWGPLIIAGCWAATLSTALTNLLSVPRLIQALGWDHIYPGLTFFSKPYGKHGEPYRGYVLVFIVSLLFLLIADLNKIAPLITNFYLASYALINFCTFHASFIRHISWRPTFMYYNMWVSLLGFCMCIVLMIVISWYMALATVFIFFALYLLVLYRNPTVGWAGSAQAAKYKDTVSELVHMALKADSVQMYSPQVLVLGQPYKRPSLLDVAQLITNQGSFLILANVHEEEISREQRLTETRLGEQWLRSRKTRGFYITVDGLPVDKALKFLIQASGLGKLSPNIVMLDYKDDWELKPLVEIETFHRLIKIGFEQHMAMSILRVSDHNRPLYTNSQMSAVEATAHTHDFVNPNHVMFRDSEEELSAITSTGGTNSLSQYPTPEITNTDQNRILGLVVTSMLRIKSLQNIPKESSTVKIKNDFQPNKTPPPDPKNNIDVWWFYDDGGLNILLPYIIAKRSPNVKNLRIHALTKAGDEKGKENMQALLKKYRINYSELSIISDLALDPSEATWEYFNSIVIKFKTTNSDVLITDDELKRQYLKTSRHLRVKELLLQYSSDADIIILTLPYPREGISPCLYMTWLEVLSSGLPPLLFVRGNSISVL